MLTMITIITKRRYLFLIVLLFSSYFLFIGHDNPPPTTIHQDKVCGLAPNFTNSPCLEIAPCLGCEKLALAVADIFANKKCLALEESNDHNHQLTPYWAQEYVGADLARGFISNLLAPEEQRQIQLTLFDDPNSSHASNTQSILINPSPFSLIPPSTNVQTYPSANYADLRNTLQQVLQQETPPSVINQSAGEIYPGLIPDYQQLLKNGTLVVFTAGNDYPRDKNVDPNAESLQDLILVGNAGPLGLAHSSSQESKNIAISAPAGAELYTGKESTYFGGTSGASALVAAALANVRAITPQLSAKNAKDLLRLASIPTLLSHQTPDRTNGPGMLNMLKMVVVAKNVAKKCHAANPLATCYDQEFQRPQNYQNLMEGPEKNKILHEFSATFPFCAPRPSAIKSFSPPACPQMIESWKNIRQLSLLENDPNANQMLSCLSRIMGYPQNAFFYSTLNAKNQAEGENLLTEHLKHYPANSEISLAVSKAKYWKTLGQLYRKGEAVCSDPLQSSFFLGPQEQQQWAASYQQSSKLDCVIKNLGNYSPNSSKYQNQLKLIKTAMLNINYGNYKYDDFNNFYQLLSSQKIATDPQIVALTNNIIEKIKTVSLADILARSPGFKLTGAFVDNSICNEHNRLPLPTKLEQIKLLHKSYPGDEDWQISSLDRLGEQIKDSPSDLNIFRKHLNEIALWNHPNPEVRAQVLGHCSIGLDHYLSSEQRLAILQQFSQDTDSRVRHMVVQNLSCREGRKGLDAMATPEKVDFYFSLFENAISEDRSSCFTAIDFFAKAPLSTIQKDKITECKKIHGISQEVLP